MNGGKPNLSVMQKMRNGGFRLLHASDVHIGTPRSRRVLKRLLAFSRTEDVDLVILAGDVFDSNRVTGDVLGFALQTLQRFKVPLLILPGNHDCLVKDSLYQRSEFANLDHGVRIFTQPEGETFVFPYLDLAVWGKPLCDYGGETHPLAGIPPRGPEKWQIAVAHGQIVGDSSTSQCIFPPDSGCSFPITVDELMQCGRDYVALGHWPMACCVAGGSTTAYYSGSPTEMGTFLIVDFIPGQHSNVTVHHI